MKCAVAIVLAIIGMAASNPVPPLGSVAIASPLLLPSAVSVSSSIINHGVTLPKVQVVPVVSLVSPGWAAPGWGWGWGKGWH